MRYPNRIAYKFKIEEGLNDVLLPKFSLQPLIENYFIHGIDYTSVENALSVEVYRKDGNIEIEVKDNGKGMSIKEAKELQNKLDESVFNVNDHNTVGLLNVHQRLKVFLQDLDYKIEIINNNSGGLTILITFIILNMSYTTIYITQTLLYLTNRTMYFKSSTMNLQ